MCLIHHVAAAILGYSLAKSGLILSSTSVLGHQNPEWCFTCIWNAAMTWEALCHLQAAPRVIDPGACDNKDYLASDHFALFPSDYLQKTAQETKKRYFRRLKALIVRRMLPLHLYYRILEDSLMN